METTNEPDPREQALDELRRESEEREKRAKENLE